MKLNPRNNNKNCHHHPDRKMSKRLLIKSRVVPVLCFGLVLAFISRPVPFLTNDRAIKKIMSCSNAVDEDNFVEGMDPKNTCLYQQRRKWCGKPPVPTILMSLGRSGSSAAWGVMSNLTGYESGANEYIGKDAPQMKLFWEEHSKSSYHWMLDYMCDHRNATPSAGLVGFKWKPKVVFEDKDLRTRYAPETAAYKYLSEHRRSEIKIVFLRRNELDIVLSRMKHDEIENLDAHCQKGDEACVQKMYAASLGFKVRSPKTLSNQVHKLISLNDETEENLKNLGIPFVPIQYEKAFSKDPLEAVPEWQRVVDFLGLGGNTTKLTMDRIQNSMSLASTRASNFHNETISNYDEVAKVLRKTNLDYLLH